MIPRQTSEGISKSFQASDNMVNRVNAFRVDPEFTRHIEDRLSRVPDFSWTDEEILRRLIELIAYSNNANAQKVTRLVDRDVFRPIFQDYSVDKSAALLAEQIRLVYWQEIKCIRFRWKVDAMVRCAPCLISIRKSHKSFMHFVRDAGLPTSIRTESHR
jgi:3-methyladenine DNA glycosylase Tag